MRTSEGRREEERVKDCRPAVGSIDEIPSVWHRCGTRVTTDMELKKVPAVFCEVDASSYDCALTRVIINGFDPMPCAYEKTSVKLPFCVHC